MWNLCCGLKLDVSKLPKLELLLEVNAIMVRTIIIIFIFRVLDFLTYKQCDQSAKVGEFNVTISPGKEVVKFLWRWNIVLFSLCCRLKSLRMIATLN